jgi:GxxExxY protein
VLLVGTEKKTIRSFDMIKDFIFKELSYSIIGAAFRVHSSLGSHLPEHCYEHALVIEFARLGVPCVEQKKFEIYYNGQHCGHFFTDIVVDNRIILELKSDERLTANHESQLFTYLRSSGLRVGYLLNFGYKSLQFKRLIL